MEEEQKNSGIEQPKKEQPKKLSYEELEKVAIQLQQQYMQMKQKMEALDATSIRLSFLFKVMDHVEAYPETFILKVSQEIQDIITLPEEEKNQGEIPEEKTEAAE